MSRQRQIYRREQIEELKAAYYKTDDADTRTRYQAVRLYAEGYGVAQISAITGCHRARLMEWCRKYGEQGVNGLLDHRGGDHRSHLNTAQMKDLCERLHQYSPRDVMGGATATSSGQYWTVRDLAQVIARWYGVTWRSGASYQAVFKHCGFSYQRTEKVYKSRRSEQVADFEAELEKNSSTSRKMRPTR
jgi:transposase